MSNLSAPHFHSEAKAIEYVEARVWASGVVCPHCGVVERAGKLQGKSTRPGLWKCYECRKPFTVKIGTIFEGSKVAMNVWLQAIYLVAGSKKGISSNQLHRILGVTLKTAWFMSHRIREAMRTGQLAPMGGKGGAVEVDETFIGKIKGAPVKAAYHHKMKVLALLDRDSRQCRTIVIKDTRADTILPIVAANVSREATIMTDEHHAYNNLRDIYAGHGRTAHRHGQYVDLENREIHSNTVEGYFSIFKRGMKGVYQHCGEQHLHRYLAEFDFRYNNRAALDCDDTRRADRVLLGAVGKRLTYDQSCARA